ncbi:MAG: hypothetical protein M9900_03600 [Flavobacteriales bacterium]|nr:hypothetical protein [Flavobacteriales bacterium]
MRGTHMSIRTIVLTPAILLISGLAAQPGGEPINQTDAQGRKQGPWQRTWAESTQLRYTGQFKDDKPVGDFTYYSTKGLKESRISHYAGSDASHAWHYHPNGQLMAEGRYVGKDKDSTWNYFDESGALRSTETWKAGKLDGTMTAYFTDGTTAERRVFRKGVAQGPAEQFYPDGKPRYKADYVNGEPEGTETYFFANGRKELEGRYVNGQRDGGWTYYNENGSVKMQALYAQGKLVRTKYENGTFTEYWEEGKPKSEETYKNGKREGPFTEWYNNGAWVNEPVKLGPDGMGKTDVQRILKGQMKRREGTYKNDMIDGPVKEYDEQGKLTSAPTYVNGTPIAGDAKP